MGTDAEATDGGGYAGHVQVCVDIGVTASDARRIIRALAEICGLRAHRLIEWSSADAEGETPASDPPLYYAALLPDDARDEMPLGLGDTPAAALADLLWALGAPALRAALAAADPEPLDRDATGEPLPLNGAR
jgi:hypothetical protein